MESKGDLLSESAWLRTYQIGPNRYRYESKFLTEDLQVDAKALITAWSAFSARQQWEFALAYRSKQTITVDDEQILNYLMGDDGRDVWAMLPTMLTRHRDRPRVLRFLKERIESAQNGKANYYQAIGIMHAPDEESLLRRELTSLESQMSSSPSSSISDIVDYIACVAALFALSSQPSDLKKLEPFLNHPDVAVRFQARQALGKDS